MGVDFANFIIIYIVFIAMFSIIGNLNFLYDCPEFESLFDSLITIVDSSMGNFSFEPFEQISDPTL